jgi:hypothetical protein
LKYCAGHLRRPAFYLYLKRRRFWSQWLRAGKKAVFDGVPAFGLTCLGRWAVDAEGLNATPAAIIPAAILNMLFPVGILQRPGIQILCPAVQITERASMYQHNLSQAIMICKGKHSIYFGKIPVMLFNLKDDLKPLFPLRLMRHLTVT